MNQYKKLREFSPEELILSEDEARIVLKFIFKSRDHKVIDSLTINNHVRGFAQGLLLEAIDASYAVGYIKALFESTANPTKGALKVIKGFGKKAAKHWFKHASIHDLQNVKIYDFVRDEIALRFRFVLMGLLASVDLNHPASAFLTYMPPARGHVQRWG